PEQRHHRDAGARAPQAVHEVGEFLAEGGGRCRLPMGARQHREARVAPRAVAQHRDHLIQLRQHHALARFGEHQRVRQVVDVLGGRGEVDELQGALHFAVLAEARLEPVLDRLDVVVGFRLDRLYLLRVGFVELQHQVVERSRGLAGEGLQLADRGLRGERHEPCQLDAHAIAGERVFAEEGPQGIRGLCVPAVERRQRGELGGHGSYYIIRAPMKLLGSVPSPYTRKVRIVLAEKKIDCDFEVVDVIPPENPVNALNPLGKVPTLVLDDGTTLFDSRVIVEFLDGASPLARLIPDDNRERVAVRRWEALADGSLDAGLLIRYESLRPKKEQSKAWTEKQVGKLTRGVAMIAAELGEKTWCQGDRYSLADIAVGCCLGWLEFRKPGGVEWRSQYPNLERHYAKLMDRPAFADTAPPKA